VSSVIARRAAAWLAMATLAAAAALLAAGAVRNWLWVILALAGLVVAVVAGWYVVSRLGAVRWLGLTVLVIWSLIAADLRWPWVFVAFLLAGASVGCA
jgi:hypothetical protein